jgi:hypothetical protein
MFSGGGHLLFIKGFFVISCSVVVAICCFLKGSLLYHIQWWWPSVCFFIEITNKYKLFKTQFDDHSLGGLHPI